MKKIIYIKGMHCVSCEMLLEDEFKNIPGVKNVRANRIKNWIEIEWDGQEPDFSEISKIAKKFGYEASEEETIRTKEIKNKTSIITSWLEAILLTIILFGLYKVFQGFGIIDKIDIQNSEMTFGAAFLIGIVASLSSCLAIVGSVVMVFSEKYKSEGKGFYNSARPNILFQTGRLISFFILGGILGLIGGEVNISGNFVSIFTILIAIVMGLLGLNILGIIPSISNFGLRMPKNFTNNWNKLKESKHKAAPFILGAFTFFLPCGFTQSMQIIALASGSFSSGGLILFFFALGTMPVLFTLGTTTTWAKSKKILIFQKVAGILIIIFAIFTFRSGLVLSGITANSINLGNINKGEQKNILPENKANIQVVEMHVTSSGFRPSALKIEKGIPVKWVIKGDQLSSCTNKMVVPSLNISKTLSAGDNIINFTPEKSGTIPFSCWMGMVQGKFIVE